MKLSSLALVFFVAVSSLASTVDAKRRAKTHNLEFDPDHIGARLQEKRKTLVLKAEKKKRGPAKFKVKYSPPEGRPILDMRLANCIQSQRVKQEFVRVFASPEEAAKNCKVGGDGHLEERHFGNTCIHYEYGGSNSFQNCYYGDPPDRKGKVRTYLSKSYR